ncbi:transporter [Hymenobacter oligotrophus]|uniref:Transporter n=1 Tax=Hymenobacter oligotrophus TaxID=2319843 RepID=A0A3B7R1X4_9BACT|nr:ion channel [Hymenobacter oligotrophus]AYA37772.1 transporter [Hymenobacter oligotrophus]
MVLPFGHYVVDQPPRCRFGSGASPDPGLGVKFGRPTVRAINHDGSFNVRRRGRMHTHEVYQTLVRMSWGAFLAWLLLALLLVNGLFALGYWLIGVEHLRGIERDGTAAGDLLHAFFFSTQTFTTVGYGAVAPTGVGANLLASFEALVGLLIAALATGLLYGRFSRPRARILFSQTAIISRRPDGTPCLQFRIANLYHSTLVELRARVMVQFTDPDGNRQYRALELERNEVQFFPLNWTLVHDITPESPLHGLGPADWAARFTEVLILIKGYDDTFAQEVHARNSYRFDEVQWNRRFVRAYDIEADGNVVLDLDRLHVTEAL